MTGGTSRFKIDAYGTIRSAIKLYDNTRLFEHPPYTEPALHIPNLDDAIRNTEIRHRIPTATDILVVEFEANTDHMPAILLLWQLAFNNEWQQMHARRFQYVVEEFPASPDQLAKVFLTIALTDRAVATPLRMLKTHMTLRLIQVSILSLKSPHENRNVMFKMDDRVLTSGQIDRNLLFGPIFHLFSHCFVLHLNGRSPSMVCAGRQIGDAMPVRE